MNGEELKLRPIVLQVIFGIILVALAFGPGADFMQGLLDDFGIDWSIIRWPLIFVAFDILAIPAIFIFLFYLDVLFSIGPFSAVSAWVGSLAYVGPYFAEAFEFIKKILIPPESWLNVGLPYGIMGFCQKTLEGKIACVGFQPWEILGMPLQVGIPLPQWLPMLLIFIWFAFSMIFSLPRVIHLIFKVLKAIIHGIMVVIAWIIYALAMLFYKIHLNKPFEVMNSLVSKVGNFTIFLFSLVEAAATVPAHMVNALLTGTVIIKLIVLLIRFIVLFLLAMFALAGTGWGMAIFVAGLLFTIDSFVLGMKIYALIGLIITIIGAVLLGIFQPPKLPDINLPL
jgi:hypothetical protein